MAVRRAPRPPGIDQCSPVLGRVLDTEPLWFELSVPLLPYLQPDTKHWRYRQTARRLCQQRIDEALILARIFGRFPLDRVEIEIVRHSSARRSPDADNLRVAGKPLIDSLVVSGVMGDDDPETLPGGAAYRWVKAPLGRGFTVVRIGDAG